MEESSILKFYSGQKVFVTGGTGFLGKVIVEKLLWSSIDLDTIYLLVRNKKGKSTEERFEDYFTSTCFDRLRNSSKDFRSKVKLITGDCEQACLGLSNDDVALLKNEVTCIIHAAANVKFDQFVREAAYINVRAVIDLVDLAKQMSHLQAFVYVSTAFSNCINGFICESFYDPPIKALQLLDLLEMMDDKTLENITPSLKGKFPNTYVYTKCIAENYIKEEAKGLPMTIVRPGVVHSAIQDPEPGWSDTFYGMTGILVAASLGVARNVYCDKIAPFWMVPVDQTANIILAAGWKVFDERSCDSKKLAIYNFVGSTTNFYTWGEIFDIAIVALWKIPVSRSVWYPITTPILNYHWYKISTFFQQIVPAYLADVVLGCLGKQKIALKMMKKLVNQLELLGYFTTRHWHFQTTNVENFWNSMNEKDKKLFDFDVKKIKSDKYLFDSLIFMRKFQMKDPDDTLPYSVIKLKVQVVLHYAFIIFFYYILYKLFVLLWNIFL